MLVAHCAPCRRHHVLPSPVGVRAAALPTIGSPPIYLSGSPSCPPSPPRASASVVPPSPMRPSVPIRAPDIAPYLSPLSLVVLSVFPRPTHRTFAAHASRPRLRTTAPTGHDARAFLEDLLGGWRARIPLSSIIPEDTSPSARTVPASHEKATRPCPFGAHADACSPILGDTTPHRTAPPARARAVPCLLKGSVRFFLGDAPSLLDDMRTCARPTRPRPAPVPLGRRHHCTSRRTAPAHPYGRQTCPAMPAPYVHPPTPYVPFLEDTPSKPTPRPLEYGAHALPKYSVLSIAVFGHMTGVYWALNHKREEGGFEQRGGSAPST
ncbi:hypothetical protein DFH09DRAFT_1355102 [Mycena vulgaris]|nr:hypothetical protein DFH09DRAFT_1355102 [Mycena vulgaris]